MLEAGYQRYEGLANSIRAGPSTQVVEGYLRVKKVFLGGGKFHDFSQAKIYIKEENCMLSSRGGRKNLTSEADKWIQSRISSDLKSGVIVRSSSHSNQTEILMDGYDPKNPHQSLQMDHLDGEAVEDDDNMAKVELMLAKMDNVCGANKDLMGVALSKHKSLQAFNDNGFIPTGK